MRILLLILLTLMAAPSFAELPTPEDLDKIEAEDEHFNFKEKEVESSELVKNGSAVICSITSPGSNNQLILQQNDCQEIVDTMRQDFCVKWPKAAYSIKQENCNLKNWEVVANSCKQVNLLGVGFCQ